MQKFVRNNLVGSCMLALASFLPSQGLCEHGYKVLYTFQGGKDGYFPVTPLVRDKSGNLYGTTRFGGEYGCDSLGCGTLFKIAPDGTKSILHEFAGGGHSDGDGPAGSLILDRRGRLFGTTVGGGNAGCPDFSGCGTVFELDPDGTYTVLYAFTGGSDGAQPTTLIPSGRNSLIGAAFQGGDTECYTYGCGVVYELGRDGSQSVMHTFSGPDGESPGGLTAIGNKLYGGTGGGGDYGYGVIYWLARDGKETVLHSFNGSDGWGPGSVVADAAGNFYGTTGEGGGGCEQFDEGCGTLFKLAPDGTLTVLHDFDGQTEGGIPTDLVRDAKGNFYGATNYGGDMSCNGYEGCGEIFKFAPDGSFTQLHDFVGTDGEAPAASLLIGPDGYLYGTTSGGGNASCKYGGVGGCGVVFEIKK